MTVSKRGRNWIIGLFAIAASLSTQAAGAHTRHHLRHAEQDHLRVTAAAYRYAEIHYRGARHHYASYRWRGARHFRTALYHYSGLQCVPYAREVSHIELSGDAFLWWAEAAGRYARGSDPVQGAVLNFRPIGRMPLGHVAVVTAVIDSRTILVTQANWIRGTITNDVTVQDVSADNDWSAVKVELGDTDGQGATYPVYGFIYNQPDDGTEIAGVNAASTEVAEAPRAVTIQTDAPDRNLQ